MFHAGVSGFAFFAVGVVSDATLFCISTAFDPQFGPQYNKGYRGNVLEMFETVEILDPLESGRLGKCPCSTCDSRQLSSIKLLSILHRVVLHP